MAYKMSWGMNREEVSQLYLKLYYILPNQLLPRSFDLEMLCTLPPPPKKKQILF